MRISMIVWGVLALMITVVPANADLIVKFDEGAPKDRFSFQNVGKCTLTNATVQLDLSGSKSGLIFDTTGNGAGVEVYQPLEFVAGEALLASLPHVKDGDRSIELKIAALAPDQTIAFTIDVDDTMGGREITVSDSEIQGARIRLTDDATSGAASFKTRSEVVLRLPDC